MLLNSIQKACDMDKYVTSGSCKMPLAVPVLLILRTGRFSLQNLWNGRYGSECDGEILSSWVLNQCYGDLCHGTMGDGNVLPNPASKHISHNLCCMQTSIFVQDDALIS